jgi:hypothetical protein
MRIIVLGLLGAVLVPIAIAAAPASPQPPTPARADAAQMSPEARAYLDHAIALFRQTHINSSKMDWPALTSDAYAAAAGAKTTADTYPAIWLIIKRLGEKHTFFQDPDQAKAQATGTNSGKAVAPQLLLPEALRLANAIGVIRLYQFGGSQAQAALYSQTGQAKISELKRQGVCRFVVDLRADSGGNMYPMISSVGALLGNGALGTFENGAGKYTPWLLKDGVATIGPISDSPTAAAKPIEGAVPVAVLIGPPTASAGEFTAMSFKGRPNTRFFGEPTAGYVTANQPIPLPDGAVIIMTVGWGIDRAGRKYTDWIEPDEITGAGGQAMDAAVKWLSTQPCRRSVRRH